MRRIASVVTGVMFVALSSGMTGAQNSLSSASPPSEQVILSKLAPISYPENAQKAHIVGTVEISLRIRQDGTVESAVATSGHTMFREAALESAQNSQFQCKNCKSAITPCSLTYQFNIVDGNPQACENQFDVSPPPTQIDIATGVIKVFAWELWTCDPSIETYKVRAAKCLYLWKCAIRYPM